MRISDWSSDVCSSDLLPISPTARLPLQSSKAARSESCSPTTGRSSRRRARPMSASGSMNARSNLSRERRPSGIITFSRGAARRVGQHDHALAPGLEAAQRLAGPRIGPRAVMHHPPEVDDEAVIAIGDLVEAVDYRNHLWGGVGQGRRRYATAAREWEGSPAPPPGRPNGDRESVG